VCASCVARTGPSTRHRLGLKPALILDALRGAEAPLFHGATRIRDFFRDLFNRKVHAIHQPLCAVCEQKPALSEVEGSASAT